MTIENRVFQPSMLSIIPALGFVLFFLFIWLFGLLIFTPLLFLLVFFGAVILIGGIVYLKVKNTYIEIKEDGIQVRKGIIAKSQSLFLFSNIQDVDESQGLLEIIFGLKTLSIKTMTAGSILGGNVSGLRQDDAKFIREFVLNRINEDSLKKLKKESPKVFEKAAAGSEADEELVLNPWPVHFFKATAIPYLFAIIFTIVWFTAGLFFQPLMTLFFYFIIYILFFIVISPISLLIRTISFKYKLGKTRIEIISEFLSFYRSTVPFYKVQDIILNRSLFDKIVGLGNIRIEAGEMTVYTKQGGSNVSFNIIPALDFGNALKLKDKIFDFLSVNLTELVPEISKRFPLEKRKILKKTIVRSLWLVIIAAIIIALISVSPYFAVFAGLIVMALILLILIILIHQWLYLKGYYYNVSIDAVFIRKGVINSNEIILPFKMIQNVFVDQDILDRLFGLYDVHISTVTNTSAFLSHIDGVNKENAEKVRDIISRCMTEQKNK
ncbi:MAG: PH domain-containing protein [Candidatus Diapherotrites archaeon]|nr:PH domain-containing protein [Candidatus Diapherotrites archaeon]